MHEINKNIIIQVSEVDNVAVVLNSSGLQKGTIINEHVKVLQKIPVGHKVAIQNIGAGEKIIRYGQTIGFANNYIQKGTWVNHTNITLPNPPDLESIQLPKPFNPETLPLNGYTFMGYRNEDGSVGTKNILGIATSVQCVSGFAQFIVNKIKTRVLPKYRNVDDVIAINHTYGCGIAINAPAAIIPIRTLQNLATNPNFGDEVLMIGLGCEKLRPENILLKNEYFSEPDRTNIMYMQDESLSGFDAMVNQAIKMAEIKLQKLNQRKREECPASDLVVGMQCGGSDAFSGITANPVVGFATDLIVRAGGSVMFSEVTEVRDAVHLLVPRSTSPEIAKKLIDEMKWYDNYLLKGEADRSANPTPGNKTGGLSNIVEKALGSVVKSGTSPIADVLGPGEKVRRKGLTFAATPASDFICGTLQLAAGMNMHVFTTGRGTPYGLALVPVIKVSSNSSLSKRWSDLIDLDAGQVATGIKTIKEMGWELFNLILEVASGKKTVACDKLKLYNEMVLFNPGPVT